MSEFNFDKYSKIKYSSKPIIDGSSKVKTKNKMTNHSEKIQTLLSDREFALFETCGNSSDDVSSINESLLNELTMANLKHSFLNKDMLEELKDFGSLGDTTLQDSPNTSYNDIQIKNELIDYTEPVGKKENQIRVNDIPLKYLTTNLNDDSYSNETSSGVSDFDIHMYHKLCSDLDNSETLMNKMSSKKLSEKKNKDSKRKREINSFVSLTNLLKSDIESVSVASDDDDNDISSFSSGNYENYEWLMSELDRLNDSQLNVERCSGLIDGNGMTSYLTDTASISNNSQDNNIHGNQSQDNHGEDNQGEDINIEHADNVPTIEIIRELTDTQEPVERTNKKRSNLTKLSYKWCQ